MNELFVTTAVADITPQEPMPLGGFVNRKDLFERIDDSLEMNGILLCQGDQRCLFLSADTFVFCQFMS